MLFSAFLSQVFPVARIPPKAQNNPADITLHQRPDAEQASGPWVRWAKPALAGQKQGRETLKWILFTRHSRVRVKDDGVELNGSSEAIKQVKSNRPQSDINPSGEPLIL